MNINNQGLHATPTGGDQPCRPSDSSIWDGSPIGPPLSHQYIKLLRGIYATKTRQMLADTLEYAKCSRKFFKDALKLKTMEEQNTAAKLIRLVQVRMKLTEELRSPPTTEGPNLK